MDRLKLSQIILYVDDMVPEEDIWLFRTNMLNADPEIWFTYYRYYSDTESQKDEQERYRRLLRYPKEEVFVITDSSDFSYYMERNGISFVTLNDGKTIKKYAYSLYCIEDIKSIDYRNIERMWQREQGIPWVICETDRMIIREQTVGDADALYEIYSDPEVKRFTEDLYEDRDREIQYLKDYINNQYRFCEYGVWALVDKGTGTLIGRAGISNRADYDEAELGYVIRKEYRKKGYATEACRAILQYADAELGLQKINAFTLKENTAGIALLHKLGFSNCGTGIIDGKEHEMYTIGFDLG